MNSKVMKMILRAEMNVATVKDIYDTYIQALYKNDKKTLSELSLLEISNEIIKDIQKDIAEVQSRTETMIEEYKKDLNNDESITIVIL